MLLPRVVDHDDRRAIAGAQAFDFEKRERAGLVGLAGVDAERVPKLLCNPFRSVQCTRQRPAHAQHELAHWLREKHRVVRDDVLDVRWRYAEQLADVAHRIRRDVALLILDEVQSRQDRRPALIRRVPLHDLFEAGETVRRVRERRTLLHQRARRFVERRAVRHLRMKAHRSTSPITTSIDPITAITSAIRPPTIKRSSAWHASSDGARALTRHGRLLPSDTTENPCSPRGPSTGTYASPSATVKPCE